mmetsp:Transcript_45035/g.141781  ORF Transcript_45035/g.141781 Transcript_45035/m.141781 type:complete len:250 (+) Transcript_45035:1770-2519(+)
MPVKASANQHQVRLEGVKTREELFLYHPAEVLGAKLGPEGDVENVGLLRRSSQARIEEARVRRTRRVLGAQILLDLAKAVDGAEEDVLAVPLCEPGLVAPACHTELAEWCVCNVLVPPGLQVSNHLLRPVPMVNVEVNDSDASGQTICHGMRCADCHVAEEAEAMGPRLAPLLHHRLRGSLRPSMVSSRPDHTEGVPSLPLHDVFDRLDDASCRIHSGIVGLGGQDGVDVKSLARRLSILAALESLART